MSLLKNSKHLKMQVSLEFLFYVIAVLLAILVYSITFYSKYNVQNLSGDEEINQFLNSFMDRLEYVYTQGNGFFMNYTFPSQILNKAYVLKSKEDFIILEMDNKSYIKSSKNINVSLSVLPGKIHKIENKEGVVYVYPY